MGLKATAANRRANEQQLTQRQQMVLDFINESIGERGYPPTLREIGAFMGISSTNGVNDHLRALERKGYLKREDMKSRALRPTNSPSAAQSNVVEVSVLGRVAAGAPIFASENIEDTLQIDKSLLGQSGENFVLRVRGDSMIEAGIFDGDYLFVRKQMVAERGQTVVALLGEEATVKYYYPERDYVRFQPANPDYAPIIVRREDLNPTQILGIVVGVYRKL
jgi:repressor LexA